MQDGGMGKLGALALAVVLTGWPASAGADSVQSGRSEYLRSCANCHGLEGRGDGPFAEILTVRPADLSTLALENGGRLPEDRLYRIIDGRLPVKGHGSGEMPIWGDIFREDAQAEAPERAGRGDTENFVSERILYLIAYLRTIQQ